MRSIIETETDRRPRGWINKPPSPITTSGTPPGYGQ